MRTTSQRYIQYCSATNQQSVYQNALINQYFDRMGLDWMAISLLHYGIYVPRGDRRRDEHHRNLNSDHHCFLRCILDHPHNYHSLGTLRGIDLLQSRGKIHVLLESEHLVRRKTRKCPVQRTQVTTTTTPTPLWDSFLRQIPFDSNGVGQRPKTTKGRRGEQERCRSRLWCRSSLLLLSLTFFRIDRWLLLKILGGYLPEILNMDCSLVFKRL